MNGFANFTYMATIINAAVSAIGFILLFLGGKSDYSGIALVFLTFLLSIPLFAINLILISKYKEMKTSMYLSMVPFFVFLIFTTSTQ